MTATTYRSAVFLPAGPAPAERPWDTAWARLIVSAGSLLALAAGAAGAALGAGPLRIVGLAVYLLFGMGAAPFALNRRMGLSLRLALGVGISMAILVLASIAMLNGDQWHPLIAFVAVCVLTVPVHVAGVVVARRDLPPWSTTPRPASLPALGLALAGAALCLLAALTHRHIDPGLWGFLPRIGPLWYAGLAVLLLALAVARSADDEVGLAVTVVLVMLVLTGTAALVYDGPRSQSAAKHVQFVEQIRDFHYLRSTVAVYNSWPGYFSAMAWLSDVTGLRDPMKLATAWPVVVGVIRVVAMRFLAGRLIAGRTVPWLAVALGVLADPIGADYFSPQSVGFVLGLVIFGLALSDLRTWPKIGAMTVVGSAVAVSHQLSPYIIGGTLAVLVVFRQVRPWWAPATLLGPAAIWALLHWSDIAGFLSFGDLGKADNFRPPETTATPGLHRLPIVSATVLALVAGALLVGLIALGVLLRHRRELRMWAIAMCPAVGLAVVAVNPYGNEGIFRATLFALPWLAILAAQAFAGAGRWTRAALPATTVALAVTFCVAAFGLDATNVLRSADREALRIFLNTEADPGQMNYMLILGPGDLPSSPPTQALTHAAIEWSDFRAEQGVAPVGTPAATEMRRATAGLRKYAAEHAANGGSLYAVWSPVSSYYGWEYGIHTPAQFAALRDAFLASPDWRPVFRSDGTVLFRYVAGTS